MQLPLNSPGNWGWPSVIANCLYPKEDQTLHLSMIHRKFCNVDPGGEVIFPPSHEEGEMALFLHCTTMWLIWLLKKDLYTSQRGRGRIYKHKFSGGNALRKGRGNCGFPFFNQEICFFLFRFVFALSLGRKFIRLGHRAGPAWVPSGDRSGGRQLRLTAKPSRWPFCIWARKRRK